jgi:hypothetical protein
MGKMIVTPTASVFAAILASLCCIGPVMVALAGVSGVAAFSMFDAYRPYFIGLTIVLIGLAFYFTYRRREVTCADGTCRVETAGIGNKIGVWSATFIAVGAIAFPYYGFGSTALSFSSGNAIEGKMDLSQTVSFFTVPLVCNAAPHIGCGSRAKFILIDLMKDQAIKEAWLNRKGTVMAIVWAKGTSSSARQTALASVFSLHKLPIKEVSDEERNTLADNFKDKEKWYKGSDVDALSIEEAGVMADRVLAGLDGLNPPVSFKRKEDRQAFREDVKAIIQNCFLSLRSFSDLDDSTYGRIEHDVFVAGEKYLGEGNMPELWIRHKEGGCCADEQEERK